MANGAAHSSASKIAQLLSEILTTHAPITSQIGETVHAAARTEWLERLEQHSTSIIGPFLDMVMDKTSPPDEIAHILQEMKVPSAELGSFAQQFLVYGIGFSVAGQIVNPFLVGLSNDLSQTAVGLGISRVLSPADVATALTQAVNFGDSQGVAIPDWATAEAAMNGLDAERFATLVGIDGQAPDGTDLFEMFRRGVITTEQLQNGFLEGPTKNKWIPYLTKLQYIPLTISDMVRAAVQNQLDYATAEDLAHQLGLEPEGWINDNPDWFQIAYNIAGRPPGPQEVGRMANRGIVPWTGTGPDVLSFEQAIAESDVKTKWTPALQAIEAWYPPIEYTNELYNNGAITLEQAQAYWKGQGVPDELIPALSHRATVQQVEQERQLAKGQVLTALYDGIVSQTEAEDLLGLLGYGGQVATYLIDITMMRRQIRAVNQEVTRVGTFYRNYKLTATDAKTALTELGLDETQITELLDIWSVELAAPVRLPSAAQIAKAFQYQTITEQDAISKLEILGYTAYDAAIILSAEAEQQITPLPANDDKGVKI